MPDDKDHMHPPPLAYVDTIAQKWSCGGEMINACLGFHAVFQSAICFAAIVQACCHARYPVEILGDTSKLAEANDYCSAICNIGSLLISYAIKKHDLEMLYVMTDYVHDKLPNAPPHIADTILYNAYEFLSIDDSDVTTTNGDDPVEASIADVVALRNIALTHVGAKARGVDFFGSGQLKDKANRTKHDVN